MCKEQKMGPRGSTARVASGLSIMELNKDPWPLPESTEILFTISDVPQGTSLPLRRISRGASMAELVLIRE